jgi:hypothetical protein
MPASNSTLKVKQIRIRSVIAVERSCEENIGDICVDTRRRG